MSDLRSLYQEVIIDHGRHPRNKGIINNATHRKEGFNPLCGDKISLYLTVNNNVIEDIKFEGSGCAISMASASLMSEMLQKRDMHEAHLLFDAFHDMATGHDDDMALNNLGKLAVLKGVSEFPSRVKCATLCWHTLIAALDNQMGDVTTE